MSSRSSFYSLPEELLTEIVKWIPASEITNIERAPEVIEILKTLRLSSPQFAYLAYLQAYLFEKIQLKASPGNVELLEKTDISRIHPFVKEIVFKPVQYSWTTTLNLFGDIVTTQALHHHASGDPEILSDLRQCHKRGRDEYIQKYFGGNPPFSDEEIQQGYDSYISHANDIKMLFDSGRLESVWTAALRSLPNTDRFQICRWKSMTYQRGLKESPGCEVIVHLHDYVLDELACWKVEGSVGDALFTTAIASASAAGTKIRSLNVLGVFGPGFAWVKQPKWSNIKLNDLEILRFGPACPRITWEDCFQSLNEEVRRRCSLTLSFLLKKCGRSIEVLDLRAEKGVLTWPLGSGVIVLPKLHHLLLGPGFYVRARPLASCIKKAKSLKYIKMESTDVSREPDSGLLQWRHIWTAIRNHRNRMMLEFDQVAAEGAAEITLIHHTSKGIDYNPSDDPLEDITESLSNFVSKTGGWNESLGRWFDDDSDGDPEYESDDDDSDDSDDDGDGWR